MTTEHNQEQQSEIKTLIIKGKEQGYLTYAEVNDHLPDDIVDPEQIEDIIGMINDMGIEVHEVAPDTETLLPETPVAADDDTATEEAVAVLSAVDAEVGRTTDPVRMYMREMGTVELLTREGEIAIAKRIEEGLNQVQSRAGELPVVDPAADRGIRPAHGRQEASVRSADRLRRHRSAGPGDSRPDARSRCRRRRGQGRRRRSRGRRGSRPRRDRSRSDRSHAPHGRAAHALRASSRRPPTSTARPTRRRRSCATRWPRRSSSSSCRRS